MNYPENYTKQLQRLLGIVNDSYKGYKEAAEFVESSELKDLFERISLERQQLAEELKEHIRDYGGNDENQNPDMMAALHRSWMGVKTAMTKKTDQTVLESCRNGDQAALDAYDDVLQGDILNDTKLKTLLTSQRLVIDEAFLELDKRYFALFKKDPSF